MQAKLLHKGLYFKILLEHLARALHCVGLKVIWKKDLYYTASPLLKRKLKFVRFLEALHFR